MNRIVRAGLAMALALGFVLVACAAGKAPKYVFLFIGDGMSVPQRMLAEEFSRKAGEGPLALNALPVQGMTRTCSADSLVTDSAAAATAMACGVKTRNGVLGLDVDGKSVPSCAVAAKAAGRKVGILTTVTLTHATPAGFYAHRAHRGDTEGIAKDLADSGFDFFAGGGLAVRTDAPYVYAAEKGYHIISNRTDFLALKSGCGKILTRFTNGPLSYALDRKTPDAEPSLAELTQKAIDVLSGDAGFFMMIEGGRIDWAGHANDAATNLRDVLALDEAVKVALAFLDRHPHDTLVVVTGDHETGGLSMGFADTGYALYMERLAHQTMSVGVFDGLFRKMLKEKPLATFQEVQPLVTRAFGLQFAPTPEKELAPLLLTAKEAEELQQAFAHDKRLFAAQTRENASYDGPKTYLLGGVCRRILARKAGVGWTTGAHTALPVLTTAKGVCAEAFAGFYENTQIAHILRSFYTPVR